MSEWYLTDIEPIWKSMRFRLTSAYTLELNEGKAWIKIERWVPLNLSSELQQCFAKSFK